jgi:hypothetical protein
MTNSVRKAAMAVCLSVTTAVWAIEPDVRALKIVPLEGEGAFNDVKRGRGVDPTVEVRDQDDRPVKGAEVVFTLPFTGPGGTFGGSNRTYKAVTDGAGRVSTEGFKPNTEEGRFNIKVTASYQGATTSAVVSQSNTRAGGQMFERGGGGSNKKLILLGLLGGGATAGILIATAGSNGGGPGSGLPPTTLAIGTVTVGAPR